MTPANFLSQLQALIVGGTGFVKYNPISVFDLRTSAGVAVAPIASGDFGLAAVETNFLALQWAAADTTEIGLNVTVPLDYDEEADVLQVALLAQMAGSTDTPGFTAEAFSKREGESLTDDLVPSTSTPLSDTAQWVFVNLTGKGLKGGDVVQVNIAPAAHGTDDLNLYGCAVVYKSCLVPYVVDERA